MRSPFQGLPREVAVLAAVAVAVAIGFGVVAPAIPQFATSFGVGKTAAGAVVSAFALMRFVSALGGGRLVDAAGERKVLAIGIGVVAVSTGLAGLSQSYVQLLVLRGIGGIGSAMFTISATALLFRVVDNSNRGRATGLFQSGFLVGGLLGPLAGGFLTDYSLRLPFYVYAVSLIAAGSIGAVFLSSATLHRDASEPADSEAATTSLREAWSNPAYRAAVAVNFAIGWAFFGVRMSLVPLFVLESLHQSAKWTGVGFLCASLTQIGGLALAGRFVDRSGRRPAMILGSAVAGLALALLAVTSSLAVFLLAMTALGAGGAFVSTAPGAVVGDIMSGRGGRVVAVFQMASDTGVITGPLAAGWLADSLSFSAAFAACAVVLFGATIFAIRMPETLQVRVAASVSEETGDI
ncbi:MAG: MFS transporter [Propionibacteriales bacterium]|nr:MFS transporter [Propionibacteriales bacterium]